MFTVVAGAGAGGGLVVEKGGKGSPSGRIGRKRSMRGGGAKEENLI